MATGKSAQGGPRTPGAASQDLGPGVLSNSAPWESRGKQGGPRLTAVCFIPWWCGDPNTLLFYPPPLSFLAGLSLLFPEASIGPRLGFLPLIPLFHVLIAHRGTWE